MKYIISIDLDEIVGANNENEAFEKAERLIEQRMYNLIIVDKEK